MSDPRIVNYDNPLGTQEYKDHHNRQENYVGKNFCFYQTMLPLCEFIDQHQTDSFTVLITGSDHSDVYQKLIPLFPSTVKWVFYGKKEHWNIPKVNAWAQSLPDNATVNVQMFDTAAAREFKQHHQGKLLFLNRIDTRNENKDRQANVPRDMQMRKELTEVVRADMTFEEMRPAYDSKEFTVHVGTWFKNVYGLSQTAMIWLKIDLPKDKYAVRTYETKKWEEIMAFHNEVLRPKYDHKMIQLLVSQYLNLKPIASFVTSNKTEAQIKHFLNPYVV